MFADFIDEEGVDLVGVEPAGKGVETSHHGATLTAGKPGILHGCLSFLMQDTEGQIEESYSVSAGLDYPGVGPQHAHLKAIGRARYESITDEKPEAFKLLSRHEGIIPALESAHALAYALKERQSQTPLKFCLLIYRGVVTKTLIMFVVFLMPKKKPRRNSNNEPLQRLFCTLKADNQGAFVPFVTIGDPTPEQILEVIKALIDGGADALELGLPFSDPVADGPVIQRANLRALDAGTNFSDILKILKAVRNYSPQIPIGLLVYANLYTPGVREFYQQMKDVGVDSVLIADVPTKEAKALRK